MEVESPGDGHCIIHSFITQIGGSTNYYIELLKKEVEAPSYDMYASFLVAQDKLAILKSIDRYAIHKDYDQELVDIIFFMFASSLGLVVILYDPITKRTYTFEPFLKSGDTNLRAVYLNRKSPQHYNALVSAEYIDFVKPMRKGSSSMERSIDTSFLQLYSRENADNSRGAQSNDQNFATNNLNVSPIAAQEQPGTANPNCDPVVAQEQTSTDFLNHVEHVAVQEQSCSNIPNDGPIAVAQQLPTEPGTANPHCDPPVAQEQTITDFPNHVEHVAVEKQSCSDIPTNDPIVVAQQLSAQSGTANLNFDPIVAQEQSGSDINNYSVIAAAQSNLSDRPIDMQNKYVRVNKFRFTKPEYLRDLRRQSPSELQGHVAKIWRPYEPTVELADDGQLINPFSGEMEDRSPLPSSR